jgi:hypothetical protein
MKSVTRMLVIVLVGISSSAFSAQAAVPETVGSLLLRLQEESAAPFIRHCSTKIPELKRPLEAEYSKFRKKFRKATAPLRAKIGKNSELSKPAPRELIAEFDQMGAQSLAQAQVLDPRTFCMKLKDNLSGATEESIQKNMQSAFAQYTAAARAGK